MTRAFSARAEASASSDGKDAGTVNVLPGGIVRQILESFSRTQCHGVVLGRNQINTSLLRRRQAQPGTDGTIGAILSPLSLHDFDLYLGGFCLVHSGSPLFGSEAF